MTIFTKFSCAVLLVCLTGLSVKAQLVASAEGVRPPLNVNPKVADVVIQGRVTSGKGEPLPGVTVVVKGTSTGATTGVEGTYSLRLSEASGTLVFSFIGFIAKEVPINGKTTINVILQEDTKTLEEVVVVGYGTQKKSDVTGAVSSVKAEEIKELPVTNAAQALQGRVAGVNVVMSGTKPGAGVEVRVRGNRSFSANNDPLYVVDGIPITGGINDIAPQDIASLEVLKDASATAIYGSRGANGVVLVTTRRGTVGKPQITYDTFVGFSKALGKVDMMNGAEFAEYKRESRRASDNYDDNDPQAADVELFEPVELESIRLGRSTDYQELMLRRGLIQNHQLGVNGGTEDTRYSISLNYFEDNGIIKIQDMSRFTLRVNLDQQIGKRIKLGVSTLASKSVLNGLDLNPYDDALLENPLGVPYDEAGNIIFLPTNDGLRSNPISEIQEGANINKEDRFRLFSSLYGELTLAEGLTYRLNFGPDIIQSRKGNFRGRLTNERRNNDPTASTDENQVFNYTLENILNYNKTFAEKHSLNFTGLYSVQQRKQEGSNVNVLGVPAEGMEYYNLGAAAKVTGVGSFYEKWNILSYMARVNYGYDSRYLLTLTGRADGSSRFAKGQKWGFFPSVALGWNVSNEAFMQGISWLTTLRLRASYGETGNTGINPYQTQGSLSRTTYSFGNTGLFGFRPGAIRNDALQWESTSSYNIGTDFGFWNNRVSGSLEFYRQSTRDLLLQRQLPLTSGFSNVLENIGSTQNTGVEMTLSAVLIAGNDFNWSVDLNAFANREKIIELYGGKVDDIGSQWFIGQPINVYYDYEKIGIWQTEEAELAKVYGQKPGEIRVRDVNNDNKITADDRIILGTPRPTWQGGMTHRFSYKNFDLSFFVFGQFGNTIISNLHEGQTVNLFGRYNSLDVDYWTPANPTNAYPRPNQNQESPIYVSTLRYFDGSFIKIRNINFGYNLPQSLTEKIGIGSIRVYATAQQPLIFSSYVRDHKGIDPEFPRQDTPSYSQYLLGLNVRF
ncbi:TonB-dependent receptor [Pontibacter sp. SGAir0037]|uniref:SusC/RagA family TonB-linked outer membrane protein n=1 Tax=Pontibacter sp. SGAir0037 TaxID=2571030 RepID=UPI0010CD3854|nr:TonB-dependent receptor [Pontibacter sp. SGAir0037]QCR22404.1 SusC/RagA family TonB-linked outer membrane protein [Pontibacter sp. SGAir0037]